MSSNPELKPVPGRVGLSLRGSSAQTSARAGDRLHPPECGENGPPHHNDSDDGGDGAQGVPARRRRHQRVQQEAAQVGAQR
ncbi:MAG: hypothetical protein JWQ68_2484, partial [Cryobacterium sp.]|nr:hypothetical protein [Cryobacterium sp.]